ncbi:MAG: DNA adenine methylase [Candidatus Thermoplasmatota archaeon]|nr:DNA adenine methylase [Candidatus Thermoplasmatota archaeon]MCL5983207.1 DNA adenine methylase [Candidatus Thermoplasmatota archaeon]
MLTQTLLPARPFLKWAGGKAQLLAQMKPFFPKDYRTYFEPFLGGGAVFFHLRPEKAVLSDSNPELINTFTVVRDDPLGLMRALDVHFPQRTEESYFYKVRATDPSTLSSVERAARTIFLNKTCFNGLYRVNADGNFNVPWGGYRNPTLYDHENLLAASALLRGKKIVLADYQKICSKAKVGDFAYLDPPYHPLSETSQFTSYTKEDFGNREQRKLAEVYRRLDRRGVLAMLSNSATPFVRTLYDGFHIEFLKATRAINSKGTGRGPIDELLITNFR